MTPLWRCYSLQRLQAAKIDIRQGWAGVIGYTGLLGYLASTQVANLSIGTALVSEQTMR